MGLFDNINQKCWAMLDWLWDRHIPIGAVFEKLRLPAILFPLAIILIILLAFFLLSSHGSTGPCGDGNCMSTNETCETCPLDCGECSSITSGLILTVEVMGQVSEPITVEIFDAEDDLVDTTTERKALFEFTKLEAGSYSAKVTCPNGKKQTSRPKTIKSGDSKISVLLPDGCFDYPIGLNNEPLVTFGNIVVTASDTDTGEPIEASVAALRVSDNGVEATGFSSGGETTLAVRSNDRYYLTAIKEGYESYDGSAYDFFMLSGDTVSKSVQMRSLGVPAGSMGSLRVCARSGTAPMTTGQILVSEIGAGELESAFLTQADNGCVTFELLVGKSVQATLISPPPNCIAPGFSSPVIISLTQPGQVNLQVTCGDPAFVKVIVHDQQGNILTDEATVTLWNAATKQQIPGTGDDSSLSIAASRYTEELAVPANTLIQAKATSVPLEFIDTVSGPASFLPGEHGSIDIILGSRDRGQFTFLGASVIYSPATPGSPIKVFVQQILFNGTVLTSENSDVTMILGDITYDAEYVVQ